MMTPCSRGLVVATLCLLALANVSAQKASGNLRDDLRALNAVAHSGSQHVRVSLLGGSDEIRLVVRDSRIGIDPAAVKGPGLGLTIMKEHLKLVGGELLIESQRDKGTTIRACIPLFRTADG